MSDKIFDLEQQIMQCWNVVDDIDMLYEYFGDNEFFKGMDPKHVDEIMNCMLGLKKLYQVKFEKTWHTFEDVTHRYHSNRKDLETITKKYKALDKRVIELQKQVRILSNERESFDGVKEHEDDYLIREWQQMQESFDFVEHEAKEREDKAKRRSTTEWDEERMDIIGRNGNDGLHYNFESMQALGEPDTMKWTIDDATPHEWDEVRKKVWGNK